MTSPSPASPPQKSGDEQLWEAMDSPDAPAIFDKFIADGWDINTQLGYYGSCLIQAVTSNNDDLVEYFLSRGADVNMDGGQHFAITAAATYGTPEIAEVLLGSGAKLEGTEALQIAAANCEIGVAEVLIKHGFNVNEMQDEENCQFHGVEEEEFGLGTALHIVARSTTRGDQQRIDMLELLLKHGADPKLKDTKGRTALELSKLTKSEWLTEILENPPNKGN